MSGGGVSKSRRLGELDALRGLVALAVVLFHYTARFHEMFPKAEHVPVSFMIGHYSVLVFFGISGFVIAFSLARAERGADFAVRRFARLFPSYWVAILITLIIEHILGATMLQIPATAIVANFSMIQGFFYLPGVDGVYWTLTIELAFYACMLALWSLGLFRRIEIVLVPWLALHIVNAYWPVLPDRLMTLVVAGAVPWFAIGLLAYRIWSGERRWSQQLPYLALLMLSLAVTDTPDMIVAATALTLFFFAMMKGWLRFLCVRPLLWLGAISYPLYLCHHNIGFATILWLQAHHIGPWVAVLGTTAMAIGLATLIHYRIENPAERAISAWWKAWSSRRLDESSAGSQPTVAA